ncbi:MAG: hypothetical protein IPM29_26315 [Planctomycetes bacterium]|nr:hypothetical protein [Planctomycetota bacterium]
MVDPRIAFDRPQPSCAACGVDLPAEPPPEPTSLVLFEPRIELVLCPSCRSRARSDGPPPPPFEPEFRVQRALRLVLATDDDLRAALRAVAAAVGGGSQRTALATLLERLDDPRFDDHDAWERRVRAATGRPDPLDVAGWLATAALLGVDAAPVDELRRLCDRARGPDELGICFGAYCARRIGVLPFRPQDPLPDGRTGRLLEAADRALLASAPPRRHPLSLRVAQIRTGVLIALARGAHADAQLGLLGQDDPRTHLLRGLRFVQQDHLAAADREFRAACDSPFSGFDDAIDAAALWNRTMRALDATRVHEARDALRACCRLAPNDVEARLALGHAYVQSARDDVAREVLGSLLDVPAIAHVRSLAEDQHLAPEQRTAGRLLYASCLLRLGEPRAAVAVLEPELAAEGEPASRRAEVLRLLAHCDMALGRDEDALAHLRDAAALDTSAAFATEVAWTFGRALRARIELHGLSGLSELADLHAWVAGPLRRRYGDRFAMLLLGLTLHQLDSGFRPQHGFGLEWTFLNAQAATALTAQYQACLCLARHQPAGALQHDLAALGNAGAPLPWASLAAVWSAARAARPDEVEELRRRLVELVGRLLGAIGAPG